VSKSEYMKSQLLGLQSPAIALQHEGEVVMCLQRNVQLVYPSQRSTYKVHERAHEIKRAKWHALQL
jgi:hypothetical protein